MTRVPPHVKAVLAALRFRGAQREGLRALDDAAWKDLLPLCDMMYLTIPLKQVCGEDLPAWVRSRIDLNIEDNTLRFERIRIAYLELAHALHDEGIEHVVLKGFAQSPYFAEDPRLRMQSDIDLFCLPESGSAALHALSGLGYEPLRLAIDFPSDQHLPTMIRKTDHQWCGNFFDPEIPPSVDVHVRFWNEDSVHFGPKGLDQFWLRRVQARVDKIDFSALHPVDRLGYAALHALRHLLCGSLLTYHIYELAWFLHGHSDDVAFWREWQEWHDDSLRLIEVICFRLASEWFNCRLPEAVQTEMNCLPSDVQRWFHKYADSSLSACFRPNKDALWLHLSLLHSPADKRLVLRKGLLGPRIPPVAAFDNRASAAHLTSRVIHHLGNLPRTLWHGLHWWWSSKDLGRQFWTF